MNFTKNPLDLVGRILIALLFVPAAISKITGFEGTVGYIQSAGLPLPTLAAIAAIAVELLAPIAIIVGFKTRYAAAILALFTVAASFGFHKFWAMPADQVMMNQMMFFKNLAIAGGLLILAAHSGLCAKKA
jgi:putative oxidoreductase